MDTPCAREVSKACFLGCCSSHFLGLPAPENSGSRSTSTLAASRSFATNTTSSLFPNTQFTNHESLPTISEAFSSFTQAYPRYSIADHVDHIRAQDYSHLCLSNHVCLDYIGIGLFSRSQQLIKHSLTNSFPSSSHSPPITSHSLESPFFDISYKSENLISHILYGGQESELESKIRKRIMGFLNISEADYSMVFTANQESAFKLLAEYYPFHSNRKLLTVYDHENEAVQAMIDSSLKRGVQVMSAEFSWPRLRIQSEKLRKMVVSKGKKKQRGLFVFPLQSKMTGARYSYLWMSIAKENGWHVLLDACALGPKGMASLGLSLFQPDFLICSFYKVFGENPSGFGCLFIKRSSAGILEASTVARGIGVVAIVPAKKPYDQPYYSSPSDTETKQTSKFGLQDDSLVSSPLSHSLSAQMTGQVAEESESSIQLGQTERFYHAKTSEIQETEVKEQYQQQPSTEILELGKLTDDVQPGDTETDAGSNLEIECKGLDHADSLGLMLINSRTRYLINWLITALMKLQHPHPEKVFPLVKIYGPKIKFDRGPAVAFNVFDWKGEKIDPILVQKLADRNNIFLSYGLLQNVCFSDKYEEEKGKVLETITREEAETAGNKKKDKADLGITVVTAAFGFLTDFEDAYRLWAFVAQFLDADFVEKERWRYMALNQKTIEV